MHKTFLAVFGFLFVASGAPTQIHIFPQKNEGKSVEAYEKTFALCKKVSDNLYEEKYYEKWSFKNQKTGEVKFLKDFPAFERTLFILFAAERLRGRLTDLCGNWTDEVNELKEPVKTGLQKTLLQLQGLRKGAAVRFEGFVAKMHHTYASKFTAEELAYYWERVRAYHDRYRLVERKKGE